MQTQRLFKSKKFLFIVAIIGLVIGALLSEALSQDCCNQQIYIKELGRCYPVPRPEQNSPKAWAEHLRNFYKKEISEGVLEVWQGDIVLFYIVNVKGDEQGSVKQVKLELVDMSGEIHYLTSKPIYYAGFFYSFIFEWNKKAASKVKVFVNEREYF